VKAFPGRQGFCVRELLHAAGKRDTRCGNAQPSARLGQQRCLIGLVASDSIAAIGDRWPDTRATHERPPVAGRAPHGEAGMSRVRHRSTQADRHATTTQRRAVRENLGGFCRTHCSRSIYCSIQRYSLPKAFTERFLCGTRFRSVSGTRMAAPSGSLHKSA
jgi:hypothetical protein